nr:hypothetical protein BaRGS_030546 [Batillaria attramentaria]
MTDFYNAFLAMLAFDQHPDDITILWVGRSSQGRDYVAHPRNKGGSVSRKIFNENELMREAKKVVGPVAPDSKAFCLSRASQEDQQMIVAAPDMRCAVGQLAPSSFTTTAVPRYRPLVQNLKLGRN